MSKQAEDILAQLVAFDTVSRNPNRPLIDFIRDYLHGFGVESEIFANKDGSKACLWATVGKLQHKGIVLAGHTDVVPVDDQLWDSDPFRLTERNGKLFARGAADMKGFIACALSFVPEFLAADSDECFHLALTSDEETDMSGAVRLTEALAAKNVKPDWIWIGEPTGLSIVDQHKGVSAYLTKLTGASGHSSQPAKGLNAIELAFQFVEVVQNEAQKRKHNPYVPSRFDPPYTTLNLGKISGGTAENVIAESCEVLWQLRAHPGEQAADFLQKVEEVAAQKLAPFFEPFAPRARMETCVCFDIPPFFPTAENPGEKALKKSLKCEETRAVGFATEAGIFQKLGAPAVICGPGHIEQAHQPNEFIDKSQLSACVDLMRRVLLSSSAREFA